MSVVHTRFLESSFHLHQIHKRFMEMFNPLSPHEAGASGCGVYPKFGMGNCIYHRRHTVY